MQRKIPVRSILFLSLIQIGLLLLLLAWWGPFYQFLLPAAVLGQADWGTGAWLAAELLLILFVMNRFFEGAVCREPGGSQTLFQRAKIWLYATILCTIGSLGQIVDSFRELGVEHLPAEVRLRFILAAGLDRGDLGWLALGRTAPGSGGDRRCGRAAQPCRPAHAVCPLRSGTVCPADGGLAPVLCGSVVGAHPVLLITPPHKIKKPGADCLRLFLCRSAGIRATVCPERRESAG